MKLREASRICLSVILAGVAIYTMLAMVDGEKVSAQGQETERAASCFEGGVRTGDAGRHVSRR